MQQNKKIISVVGARPNFMKVAPIHKAFSENHPEVTHLICHTGQHYDQEMSKVFFEELGLPQPDFYLGIHQGSQIEQIAQIMMAFEKIIAQEQPDLVIVVGDVNSTLACGLASNRNSVPLAHVEAGLRSNDRAMPEEINRILTDRLADYLFISEESGMEHLKAEGNHEANLFMVGNVMIDSLVAYLPGLPSSEIMQKLGVSPDQFMLVTMHRPSNVDHEEKLLEILTFLNDMATQIPVVFPMHPRTRNHMNASGLIQKLHPNIVLCDPLGYRDFMWLVCNSKLVVTDSGGIQEETTYLQKQCITVRENTERPITVRLGTNQLIGTDMKAVKMAVEQVLQGKIKPGEVPPLWDGKAAIRICDILINLLNHRNEIK